MSLFTNLMIFYFCLAVMFLSFGVSTPFTEIASGSTKLYNSSTGAFLGILPADLTVAGIIAAIAGVSLLAGSAAIPVLLGLFIGVIVLPLFTFPTGLIYGSGMPDEFRVLGIAFFTVLQILFIISVVSYAKGSGD